MKNNLTSLALLLLFATSSSAQSTFERHYGAPSKLDAFSAIVPAADGGYLCAGTTANFGSEDWDIMLIKTDADGNAVWTKTWGGPGNDGAAGIVNATGGNGYLLAGYTAGANGDRDFLALRLDENGEEMWRIVRGGSDDDAATHALVASNGDFLVSGHTIASQFAGQEVLAIRLSATGNVVWENTYSPDESKGAVETADGGFILPFGFDFLYKINAQGVFSWEKTLSTPDFSPYIEFIQRDSSGQILIGGGDFGSGSPFLAFLDDDGNIASRYHIQDSATFAFSQLQRAIGAVPLAGGTYALAFRDLFSPTASPFTPGLAVFSPSGDTLLWYSTYEALDLADIGNPGQLIRAGTGADVLLAGSTSNNDEGVNAMLAKYSGPGAPLWRKSYGVAAPADNEGARKVLQTSDGGYIVLANKAVAGNSRDIWLIKTDANGSVQWDAAYGFPDADDIAGVDATPDGGYIATAYNGPSIRVFKISGSGQLQWLKKFDTGLADGTFGIRATADNGCLLIFPAIIPNIIVGSTLMKVGPQGDSLWSKYYSDLGSGYDEPFLYGIAFASDNRFALCGGVEAPPNGDLWPVVAFTDINGNLLSAKAYDTNDLLAIMIDVHTTASNGFVTHGIRIDNNTGTLRPLVIRTDTNGNLLWTAKPDDPNAGFLFPWASAYTGNSGHTFLFEQKRLDSGNKPLLPLRDHAGSVHKLNADGQIICDVNFGLGKAGQFSGGATTSDGGAVAVGNAIFDNSTDAWIVKMNPDCTVGFQTPLAPPFGMRISPSPSSGPFVLEIESEINGSLSVDVVNAAGDKVLEWHGRKNAAVLRQAFDLSSVADGVYFVRVQIGEKARVSGWVKHK